MYVPIERLILRSHKLPPIFIEVLSTELFTLLSISWLIITGNKKDSLPLLGMPLVKLFLHLATACYCLPFCMLMSNELLVFIQLFPLYIARTAEITTNTSGDKVPFICFLIGILVIFTRLDGVRVWTFRVNLFSKPWYVFFFRLLLVLWVVRPSAHWVHTTWIDKVSPYSLVSTPFNHRSVSRA